MKSSQLVPTLLSDTQLLRRCGDHLDDTDAWDEFVLRYETLITRSITRAYRRFTRGSYPDSWRLEELVQEVYLRLLNNDCLLMRQVRGESESCAKVYLSTISSNTTGDVLRREWSRKRSCSTAALDEVDLESASSTAVSFIPPEGLTERDLVRSLARYSTSSQAERDVKIFLLHVGAGLTAQEIAQVAFFGLQPASVMSILLRTRSRLKKAFEQDQSWAY